MAFSAVLHTPTELIRTIRPHTKNLNREVIRNVLVSGRIRMKIISRIIQRVELTRYCGIGQELIKVHDGIKNTGGADESIDPLTCLLALRIRVRLLSKIGWCRERCDSSAENRDAVGVDKGDHLLVRLSQSLINLLLRFGCCRCTSDIIYTLEDHGILYTRMRQDVAINTAERVGAETVC